MLHEKAKDLEKIMKVDFDPSLSWVFHWQECNLIIFKCRHGEKQEHDSEAAENWIVSVWPKIYKHYSASEIYNCDEMGHYFCALPEGTLYFKNEKLSGSKKSKECFTILLTANMGGLDKL